MVELLLLGLFVFEQHRALLFELVEKLGLLTPHLDQLFEFKSLVFVHFYLMFLNEGFELSLYFGCDLRSLRILLECVGLLCLASLFRLIEVVDVAFQI